MKKVSGSYNASAEFTSYLKEVDQKRARGDYSGALASIQTAYDTWQNHYSEDFFWGDKHGSKRAKIAESIGKKAERLAKAIGDKDPRLKARADDWYKYLQSWGAQAKHTATESRRDYGGLEKTAGATAGIIGLIGAGIFFSYSSITGNAVANLSSSTGNWIGAVFLLLAIVGAFFFFRGRNKKVVKKK
jgi:hypothetical protein